jgi:hypothetical protein
MENSIQKPISLAGRMAKVMAGVHRVKKGGFNQHHQYKFATAEDVSDLIRDLLAENGVAFLPSMENIEFITREGSKSVIARCRFTMRFIDEAGDHMTASWFSEAMDTQDKALNKAATAAVKYFLLKTFLVSTGDEPDPDADAGDDVPKRGLSAGRSGFDGKSKPASAATVAAPKAAPKAAKTEPKEAPSETELMNLAIAWFVRRGATVPRHSSAWMHEPQTALLSMRSDSSSVPAR